MTANEADIAGVAGLLGRHADAMFREENTRRTFATAAEAPAKQMPTQPKYGNTMGYVPKYGPMGSLVLPSGHIRPEDLAEYESQGRLREAQQAAREAAEAVERDPTDMTANVRHRAARTLAEYLAEQAKLDHELARLARHSSRRQQVQTTRAAAPPWRRTTASASCANERGPDPILASRPPRETRQRGQDATSRRALAEGMRGAADDDPWDTMRVDDSEEEEEDE